MQYSSYVERRRNLCILYCVGNNKCILEAYQLLIDQYYLGSAGLLPRLGNHGSVRTVGSGMQWSNPHLTSSIRATTAALAMKPERSERDSVSSNLPSQSVGIAESSSELVDDSILGSKKHRTVSRIVKR